MSDAAVATATPDEDALNKQAQRDRMADLAVIMTNLAEQTARVKKIEFLAGQAWQECCNVAGVNLTLDDLKRATQRLNAAQAELNKPKLVVP